MPPYQPLQPATTPPQGEPTPLCSSLSHSNTATKSIEKSQLLQGLTKKARYSKVRSGCITCKRRHVKCDEKKPTCNRCSAVGVSCDGYQTPKGIPIDDVSPSASNAAQEGELLQNFVKQGVVLLSGYSYSSTSFWEAYSPQLSEAYPAVRHALLAFAARVQSVICRWDQHDANRKALSYRSLALMHYNKAIGHLTRNSQPTLPPEGLLTCCLIFTGMELWPHRGMAPTTHLAAAFRLMRDRPTDAMSIASEEGWTPLLTHLIRNALAFADEVPEDLKPLMLTYAWVQVKPKAVPQNFENHKEALEQLETLLKWILAFSNNPSGQSLGTHRDLSEFSAQILRSLQRTAQCLPQGQDVGCQWNIPFFLMHHRVMQVMLETSSALDEMVFDTYTLDFEYILHECEAFLEAERKLSEERSSQTSFNPTLGLLAPLFFVATRCRIAAIRRRAIVALHAARRRERTWNSCIAAMLAHFVVEVEEVAGNDLVQSQNRIRLVKVIFLQESQEIRIRYKHAPFDVAMPLEEGVVSWKAVAGTIDPDFECVTISGKVLRASGYSGILLVSPPISCQCGNADYT